MADPRQPAPEVGPDAPARGAALELGSLRAPHGVELSDPLSPLVYAWLVDFAKAVRGVRVYAENNEMFQTFVDRALAGLGPIFEQVAELNISVREDRLLFNGDSVLVDADREEGIPFIFYRNAFRRFTLLRGIERDELIALMRAIVTDYGGADYTGEDLVTALWRMSLPHLRYLTIDALTSSAGGQTVDVETKRLQANIEDIVAAIYRHNAVGDDDDDVVAGVSITKEDLEALKEIRTESVEDLEILDRVTERAIADIPQDDLQRMQRALARETHDELVRRVMGIFLRILFREQSGRESAGTIQTIHQLFDSMVLSGRFDEARELVERLRHSANHAEDLREMHIARHLLGMFTTPSRVAAVLEAFNEEYGSSTVADKVAFLRSLGSGVVPTLLEQLETLATPGHRRLVCEVIVEFGVPEPIELMRQIEGAKWFVVRDILGLAQHHPPQRISAIIATALKHEHPKVRQHAVGMLRAYRPGLADKILAERLHDDEIDVRLAAARVAAARRSSNCAVELERLLSDDSVFDREPRELRTLMAAYAAIAGQEAVPLLDKILSPSFFARLKSLDAQIAAAFALASIGGEGATAALQRGARTLSTKVREACKRALAKELGKGESREDILAGRGLRIPDASTTNPDAPLPKREAEADPTPSGGTPLDPTPPRGNSADVEFSVGPTSDLQGELASGPAFELEISGSVESTAALHHLERDRPSLPRVDAPHPVREQMPDNLPLPPAPDPSVDAGPSERVFTREELTGRLPPAPGAFAEPPGPPRGPEEALRPAAPPEARTESLRAPEPADAPEESQRAYDEVQRELMAYLGFEPEGAAPELEPAPSYEQRLDPRPSAEHDPPSRPDVETSRVPEPTLASQPRFGGAAAESGIFEGAVRDSAPEWGVPTGPRIPPEVAREDDLDIPIEAPTEIEEIPARAYEARVLGVHGTASTRPPPSEAATDVGPRPHRAPPPEAVTEVERRRPSRIEIDDLVLDDDKEGDPK